MKRAHSLTAGVLACTAAVLACTAGTVTISSAQSGPPSAHASRIATVELHHTSLGKILTTASGFTLYEFTKDQRNKSSCAKISGCLGVWPALQTASKPTAGPGVKASLLSTIGLPKGGKQVTYAGHPLYIYSGDSGPGETSYVGETAFGGRWYAVNASSATVK
jgi:predicted lipoprotein with Yx(FWY)xxD motif